MFRLIYNNSKYTFWSLDEKNTHVIKYEAGRFGSEAANDEIYCNDTDSLESQLSQSAEQTIYIASAVKLITTVELAFKHQAIVYLTPELKYDFSNQYHKSQSNLNNALKLLSLAREPQLLNVAIAIVAKYLKHRIPFKMSLASALELVEQAIHPALNVSTALEQFSVRYRQHQQQIKKYIAPSEHHKIKKASLSYQHDLLDFLIHHEGIFVLSSGMGSGKSTYGIKALFEYLCALCHSRPALLTPDIALSKQIIDEKDSRHYLNYKKALSIAHLEGLVCCVNSATTKDKFTEYIKASEVLLVEEIEECLLALTQRLIKSGSLSDRAEATAHFFSFFHQKKVVIADALFSDLTARQIIEETGRDIYVIETTDALKSPKKQLTVMESNTHIEKVINQVDEHTTEIGFSDGAQKESNYFFKLHDVIKSKTGKLTKIINATFIKGKEGGEFLSNVSNFLRKHHYIQISPVLTNGLHFLVENINRVNFFASQTILPTQLIQSSGRFRFAKYLQVSFSDVYSKYQFDDDSIIMEEVVATPSEYSFSDEFKHVENNPQVKRLVERIKHNNFMRQNYENNTLILFELLGGEIHLEERRDTTETFITKTSPQALMELSTPSPL